MSFHSAALGHLWHNHNPRQGNPHTHGQMHNSNMEAVLWILGYYPYPYPDDTKEQEEYWTAIRAAIRDLPPHLRESGFRTLSSRTDRNGVVKPGKLCEDHKGMKAEFVYEIWKRVKGEFDHRLGPFLHPFIMKESLTPAQERQMRQLEPVLQLWHQEFNAFAMTPLGRDPIRSGFSQDGVFFDRWVYQKNQCPACMLARIGSDERVLFALYAGMVGHISQHKLGTKSRPKSSRVRWVDYCLRQHHRGDKLASEAWDLGEQMRKIHQSHKEQRRSQTEFNFYGRTRSTTSDSQPNIPSHPIFGTIPDTMALDDPGENPFTDPHDQADSQRASERSISPPTDPHPSSTYSQPTPRPPRTQRPRSQRYRSPPRSPPTAHRPRTLRTTTLFTTTTTEHTSTLHCPCVRDVRSHTLEDNISRGPSTRSHRAETDNVSLASSGHSSLLRSEGSDGGSFEDLESASVGSFYCGVGWDGDGEEDKEDAGYESGSSGGRVGRSRRSGSWGSETGAECGDDGASDLTTSTSWGFY